MQRDAPDPDQIARELEELKAWLVGLTPDDLDRRESEQIGREISSIRLQLKRLEADRIWAMEAVGRQRRQHAGDAEGPLFSARVDSD